jgi:hypothetical protein
MIEGLQDLMEDVTASSVKLSCPEHRIGESTFVRSCILSSKQSVVLG